VGDEIDGFGSVFCKDNFLGASRNEVSNGGTSRNNFFVNFIRKRMKRATGAGRVVFIIILDGFNYGGGFEGGAGGVKIGRRIFLV